MIDFQTFAQQGYLILPETLASSQTAKAIECLDANQSWPDQSERDRDRGWRTRKVENTEILDLLTEKIKKCIETGFDKKLRGVGTAQHAQVMAQPPKNPTYNPHVDGAKDPNKPVHEYGLQVGVLLTNLTQENAGNFTVWPGSHVTVRNRLDGKHGKHLGQAVQGCWELGKPQGTQIKGCVGTIIINHHLLVHGTAPNYAGIKRDMIFFRLAPEDLDGTNECDREKMWWDDCFRYSRGWCTTHQ